MRSAEEMAVLKQFASAPPNVREAFPIYDSIVIAPTFYGNESSIQGWFGSLNGFSGQAQHSFFKSRTWAQAGLQYTNQNNVDNLDYAFIADSIGVAIWGPPNTLEAQDNAGAPQFVDSFTRPYFVIEALQHMALEFKVQQDVRLEAFLGHLPPGYGPYGGGTALGTTNAVAPAHGQIPYQHFTANQGLPILSNRYPFPDPIGIPRTATIEAVLHVGQLARDALALVDSPRQSWINSSDGAAPYTFFDARYVIQVSLIGTRLVQQRAQYHR